MNLTHGQSWVKIGLRPIQDLRLEGASLGNKTLCGLGFQPISKDTAFSRLFLLIECCKVECHCASFVFSLWLRESALLCIQFIIQTLEHLWVFSWHLVQVLLRELKCHCLRKSSRGQKLWSTDLAKTWNRSWVWWDISKATFAHFSFGVTEGVSFFCPLSTKNPAFQGAFWKCHNSPLVNFAAKCIWP